MADIQTQLPVKLTDGINTAAITSGSAIRVDGSTVTQPVSISGTVSTVAGEISTGVVASASDATATANGSVGSITYTVTAGKTLFLKQVFASASGGPCKVVVEYGATPTIVAVGFFSAAVPYINFFFAQPIPVSAGTTVTVAITNNAGAAQDVYATIFGIEQ